jgi:hypothetical protein
MTRRRRLVTWPQWHAGRALITGSVLCAAVVGSLMGARPISAASGPSMAAGQAPPDASSQQALLNEYCVRCHNDRRLVAGLSLDGVDPTDVSLDAEVWEKVLRKLQARSMPPVGAQRPDEAAYVNLVASLEGGLDRAARASPDPGRPASFHRLNRTEYQHAVRDLLALDVDVTNWLPGDDAAYGFDNNADVLSMSPALLDAYLSAASKVSRLAVGDLTAGADVTGYRFSKALLQEERHDELPFGSRGGGVARHYFPLDGEYVVKLDLAGPRSQSEQIEVRLDGVKVGDVSGQARPSLLDPVGTEVRITASAGSHTVGVVFLKRMLAPEGRFPAYFPWANSAVFATTTGASQYLHVDGIEITGPFSPTGTGDTASRRRIFSCQPAPDASDAESCAREVLGTLARRAYRRPVTSDDLDTLLQFYRQGRDQRDAGGFEAGIRVALTRLLVDPDFLYRTELDPRDGGSGTPYRLSDIELASRLSFFLWSSIPDDELLTLAEQNRLADTAVFDRQVRRMLADERASALVTSFGAQWLFLRNLRMVSPDSYEFPEWDDDLREAMARETELFLESQRRENRPLSELLTADYTFVNERLARHYGLSDVYGSQFRRIALAGDRRAGLLGHASILTVTSFPNRTSPVVRGKWLLENMLGMPPPAPPPDVPELPENENGEAPRSIRERLEQHRRNPVCASCHATMDPLGFALEPFDAIGRWRTTEDGQPVDARGALIDGTQIDGPGGLRDMLVGRQDEFIRTVTEKLLTYAIGRGVEYYDMPAVRQIQRDAADTDHRWESIILGITKSTPFRMRARRGGRSALVE